MAITLAKTAGFCFGVNRAVSRLSKLIDEGERVCTLGPIIHNPQFIDDLKKQGVKIIESPGEAPEGYTTLVRTHGVTKDVLEELERMGLKFNDETCPFVKKIQRIVAENSSDEVDTLIAGDKNHPEVLGIRSYCGGKSYVFNSLEELEQIFENENIKKKFILVAQTTFSVSEFKKCLKFVNLLCTNALIFDTICSATFERQEEARRLSLENDCMIVVGGRCSSNTDKLRAVCEENCKTYLVEDAGELSGLDFSNCRNVGITAGASTPDSIIKEVRNTMSDIIENTNEEAAQEAALKEVNYDEMSFEDALEESLKSMSTDKKVKGTVVRILPNEIQVDIGRKQTGLIPIDHYSADPTADPSKELKVGDELELVIMKTNDMEGTILLSKRLIDESRYWDEIVKAEKDGTILSGKVVEVINKGVIVISNGNRIFIPASLATVSRNDRLEDLLNQTVSFTIVDAEKKRRAVGSIRAAYRSERKQKTDSFWETAAVGQVFTGPVVSVTEFGAFVDLGGVHGLVHRSELSWKRIKHPSDVVKPGDIIEVYIKNLDNEKKKISLGYKKVEDNPWEVLRRDYPVGSVVEVEIAGMTTFGAFGRIIPGVDGLIHISQISAKRIAAPQEAVSLGEKVMAKITEIDFDKKRVSLSIRALLVPEEEEESLEAEMAADGEKSEPVSIDDLLAGADKAAE